MKLAYLVFLLAFLPFVSAYTYYGYDFDSYSLQSIFENELILFAMIFLVAFALTYFALGKSLAENRGAAVLISAIISLFIAFAVSQKTRYYGYLGETIGNWLLIIAVIVGIIIFIKVITGLIAGLGLFISLFGIWYLLQNFNPYDILPDALLDSNLLPIYKFVAGTGFLILLIIALIIVLLAAYAGEGNDKIKNWFWRGKKKESLLERLGKTKV